MPGLLRSLHECECEYVSVCLYTCVCVHMCMSMCQYMCNSRQRNS